MKVIPRVRSLRISEAVFPGEHCNTGGSSLGSVMPGTAVSESGLHGRRSECEMLDQLVASARDGQSQVLVLRGEAGVGKSALLEYLVANASGCRVARVVGDESEMELAFAGLHQFCAPMLDHLDRLPEPQRGALTTAFGLTTGDPPDRFLVGLAVLSLLAEIAEERPLLCVVDDAQWLDGVSAQTIAFVARRLLAEPIALVVSVREPTDEREFRGLPELLVRGLNDVDARVLLDSVLRGPVDEPVRDRIVAETRGNPLAILELPHGLTPAELAGGFGLPTAIPLASQIEQGFARRLQPLPAPTRLLLLTAAAEPIGDVTLLWRAAALQGIGVDAAFPAETDGLLEIGARVRFRHPLVRSAVYRSASLQERRDVHAALAQVTDPEVDPDRRAWHRAHATIGPDEDVASELERSASRAQTRGGLAAAAAFLEEAVRLTPDPALRAKRALAAAQAKHEAGAPEAALALLALAETGPPDALQRARVDLLRGQIAAVFNPGNNVPPLLLMAAQRLEALDVGLARETYLDALTASVLVGRRARDADLVEVALAAAKAPPPEGEARGPDLLLDGLALLATEGREAGTPVLKRALTAFRDQKVTAEEERRWLWLVGRVAQDLWEDECWEVLCERHVRLARQAGALSVLPIALRSRMFVHSLAGELAEGAVLAEEVEGVNEATGSTLAAYGAVALAAWRGDESKTTELINETIEDVERRGEGMGLGISYFLSALLYNGLGRYADALAAAETACEYPDLGVLQWALTELIEAATRSGNPEQASAAFERLREITRHSGTDWAIGIEVRSQALLTDDQAAEGLYLEAIDRLGRTRVRAELARAHLLYGEWLRRTRRRLDARQHLRTAHTMFSGMGAEAFAERARRELVATGETVRKRNVETRFELTAQEAQIARMAADGSTNPEIGAELFISARTVEWHLRKVYPKLGITSRRELRKALPDLRESAGVA